MIIPKRDRPYSVLLVDGEQLLWRGVCAAVHIPPGKLQNPGGFCFLKSLVAEVMYSSASTVIICWESGTNWRQGHLGYKEKLPEDGANRPKELDAYRKMLFEFLSLVGVWQAHCPNMEADDVIAMFARNYSEEKRTVLILSKDHDYHQLVSLDGVHVKFPSKKGPVILTREAVTKMYNIDPALLPSVWSLCGDDSDRLKGIPGIGPVTAVKLIQKLGPIRDWVDADIDLWHDKISPQEVAKLVVERAAIKERYRLVDLLTSVEIPYVLYNPVEGIEPTMWTSIFESKGEEYEMRFLRGEYSRVSTGDVVATT